jgi:hypothetical protein
VVHGCDENEDFRASNRCGCDLGPVATGQRSHKGILASDVFRKHGFLPENLAVAEKTLLNTVPSEPSRTPAPGTLTQQV